MDFGPIRRGYGARACSGTWVRRMRSSSRMASALAMAVSFCFLASSPGAHAETALQERMRLAAQRAGYDANSPKSIIELQLFRKSASAILKSGAKATLIALNPAINSWLLLKIEEKDGKTAFYHLENPKPETQEILLERKPSAHIVIRGKLGTYRCVPWKSGVSPLSRAKSSGLPFSPLCGGRLYLRNKVRGSSTNLEATAAFLRDNVPMGESLVGLVKATLYKDKYFETAQEVQGDSDGIQPRGLKRADLARAPVVRTYISMNLKGAEGGRMRSGAWYPVENIPGVYAATIQPGTISQEILGDRTNANWLDGVESRAQAYFLAFDLTQLRLGYEVGTTHPRLDWSSRPSGAGRDRRLPGPDGIRTAAPLVNLGMISPAQSRRIVATFTGGFKRDHGAFRYGPKASTNHGHHYGFIVHGVIESKLQPGLATLYILNDGTVGMKTWTRDDDAMLPKIRFARQNGVPLVVRDPKTGRTIAGPLVRFWGPGNWSGSAKVELRTLRASACLREAEGKQFLIYGYFSTATPSALARTYQAFSCDYAMLLDMNALEHTYSAVYVRENGELRTQHLLRGMAAVDKRRSDGSRIPRFIGFSDNRDFFYLTRKEE